MHGCARPGRSKTAVWTQFFPVNADQVLGQMRAFFRVPVRDRVPLRVPVRDRVPLRVPLRVL